MISSTLFESIVIESRQSIVSVLQPEVSRLIVITVEIPRLTVNVNTTKSSVQLQLRQS